MRPARFILHQPQTIREAVNLAKEGIIPLAGGQSLVPELRQRNWSPAEIFSIAKVADLSETISFSETSLNIGARVTVKQLLENQQVKQYYPWLREAASKLGDVQVRNFATVVGNVCWSDPRANLAVALLASDAKILILNENYGIEPTNLNDFFTGFRKNTLGSRIACGIEVPYVPNRDGTYMEFSRQPQDLALVNLGAVSQNLSIRLVVGGLRSRPILIEIDNNTTVEQIIQRVKEYDGQPFKDQFISYEHKINLVEMLFLKAKQVLQKS